MSTILITGAAGQIGSELTVALSQRFPDADILATDIRRLDLGELGKNVIFEQLDVMDANRMASLVADYKVSTLYHMAAMLSATAEHLPAKAWALNVNSLLSVLNLAEQGKIKRIFWPSSIAVFGPNTPSIKTPQHTTTDPTTVYGIGKLAGERWCDYYFKRFGVDVRSLRYPAVISWKTKPGGGTTDYAVEIFDKAVKCGRYDCFVGADVSLPMLYMPDAVAATIRLMEAPAKRVRVGTAYNLGGMSFSPAHIGESIQDFIPDFVLDYKPDFRDAIARSWPSSIDDQAARTDWGWAHRYDLAAITEDMLLHLGLGAGV